ncbi:TIGR01548 family HAD-type hydrolase [Nodosilinea sp. P-1105]|uniref:TIGR01548 family HAD-type hydrolase n=1 Tax=Nodosilinea sp. P-1105 TaxID=2546229 RepID=UPI00146C7E3C|nr:TIGR01548 family HAD-type hydrolase [Nodosilinea sp. P-1105]NMF82969.1 TIGR01548 family HAD-type hydrolase [Nodosilinea sp. P-1105]
MTFLATSWAILIFDIDGVIRDVGGSYRRALADTVEQFTDGAYRPTAEAIDALKSEGTWNNDWQGSQELVYRYFEGQGRSRGTIALNYDDIVDFFQRRYRGADPTDPNQWTGYITEEPLLVDRSYFEALTNSQVAWGFFSGATRGSAHYVLTRRLGLDHPALVAMEDAPGKPDPTGLFAVVETLTQQAHLAPDLPVIYTGDTVADMHTIVKAKAQQPQRRWLGVGVLPPHVVAKGGDYQQRYGAALQTAGAEAVVDQVTALTSQRVRQLI